LPSADGPEKHDARYRFAVTGAGGFIGRCLVRHLSDAGYGAIAVVRDERHGRKLRAAGADVRVADVTDRAALTEALAGAHGVFHLAALFNHAEKSWDDYRAVNVSGTLNVLAAARDVGCQRVVHCSTVGVATEAHAPPYSEETPYSPLPDNKYEVTKAEGEMAARDYAAANGLSLAVIRPAQVYGPGDKSKAKFYRLVKRGIIVDPGDTKKHLIYVDDLCEAFITAMTAESADNEIFLIAGKRAISLTELVEVAAGHLSVPVPRLRVPVPPVLLLCIIIEKLCTLLGTKPWIFRGSMDFFVKSIECNVSKAEKLLGFRSKVSVRDGVARTVAWLEAENLI